MNGHSLPGGYGGHHLGDRRGQLSWSGSGKVGNGKVTLGETELSQPAARMWPRIEVHQPVNPPRGKARQITLFPGVSTEQDLTPRVYP